MSFGICLDLFRFKFCFYHEKTADTGKVSSLTLQEGIHESKRSGVGVRVRVSTIQDLYEIMRGMQSAVLWYS